MFLLKLDPAGNFVWVKEIGGTSASVLGFSVKVDGVGNIYSTGRFQNGNGIIDFDPSPSTFTLQASFADVFVLKLDASGNFVWAKKMGGTGAQNEGHSIAVDVSGNVYTTGYFIGTADYDPGPGTFNLIDAGTGVDYDIFVSKLDANGNFVWAKSMGSTLDDRGYSIGVDASGNVYTTGYFEGTVDFDPDPSVGNTFNLTSSSGTEDIFISKLDASGNFVWAKQIGGGTSYDEGFGLALDALGDVYITGDFNGTVDFDPNVGISNLIGGTIDVFVAKLDASGNYVWAKNMGGSSSADYGYSIAVDAAGSVYTTGSGSGDFDPGLCVLNLASGIFVHKLSLIPINGPTLSISAQTNVLCKSGSTGSATISASPGSGFTYTWSPSGGNSASASGLAAGTYSIAVSNSCGIVSTQTVLIAEPSSSLSLTAIASSSAVCAGNSSTLTATGSGGTGTITYTWVSGPTNSVTIVSPTTSSIYTVNIKDANNCSKSQTVSVATKTVPIITINSGSICSGNSFTINPSGASTYTYSSGSDVVTPTTTSSYTVIGTGANGCTNTAISNITVDATPTIVIGSISSNTICSGQNVTITPTGGSGSSYTITPVGTTGSSFTISPTATTTYTINGTNALGCVSNLASQSTTTITVNATPTISIGSISSNTICSGQSVTITPTGGTGSSYTITPGGATGSSFNISPTATTGYTINGANTLGCISSTASQLTTTITVNVTPTIAIGSISSNAICLGQSVTITPTGGTGSNYTITPGGTTGSSFTISPTATTGYTINGVSIAGCISTTASQLTTTITVNTTPTIAVSPAVSTICSGSTVTLTASGANTYTWTSPSVTTSTVSVSPGSTTIYTVTGSSAVGSCTATGTATINVGSSVSVSIASISSSSICSGNSTIITPGGASSYTLTSSTTTLTGTNFTVSPAANTTYSLMGSSGTCASTNIAVTTITVNALPSLTLTASSASICPGQSATITPTGASSYTLVNTGASITTNTVVSPLITTTYTVTGRSAAGCLGTPETIIIYYNDIPPLTLVASNSVICAGQTVTLTANGTSTYSWTSPASTNSTVVVTPTINTTYVVKGTDALTTCSNSATYNLTVNNKPSVTLTSTTTVKCLGQADGSATVSVTGGTPAYSYSLNGVASSSVATGLAAGSYTMIVNDSKGCKDTLFTSIASPSSNLITSVATSTTGCGLTTGAATVTASGGWGTPYTYTISNSVPIVVSSTNTAVGLGAGAYTADVKDLNGCIVTQAFNISNPNSPTITATANTNTICSGSSSVISPTLSSGASSYTITGTPSTITFTNNVIVTPTLTTVYNITGTDGSSCVSNSLTYTVTVNPTPAITLTPSSSGVCSGNSATLTPTGANTYTLVNSNSPILGNVVLTPTATTVYTVTGTSSQGCAAAANTIVINYNAIPTLSMSATNPTICSGTSVLLNASGADSYSWINGPGSPSYNVSPSSTSIYTVIGTNTTTACQSANTTVTVTVNQTPSVTATASSATICSGGNSVITPTLTSGAGSYTITGTPTPTTFTNNVTVTPTLTTVYNITGEDGSSCVSNSLIFTVTVNSTPVLSVAASSSSVCEGSSITLTPTGANTYTLVNDNTPIISNVVLTPTATTIYSVTGISSQGCVASITQTILISYNSLPTLTMSATSPTICSGTPVVLTANGADSYNWVSGPGTPSYTVSPISTTVYTVIGTNTTTACQSANTTVTVTVNQTPTITSTANSATICSGGSSVITPSLTSGAGSYTITGTPTPLTFTNNVTITPALTTIYNIVGADGTSCMSSNILSFTVNVNPSAAINLTTSSSNVCGGSSVTLTPTGANTYTLINTNNPIITDVVVTPTATTIYTVSGTNNCGTATQTVLINYNLLPILSMSATNPTICSGATAVLIASGADSYNWVGGPGTASYNVSPNSTTVYTVVGTNTTTTCQSANTTVTVTVNQTPTVTATAMTAIICSNGTIVLNASSTPPVTLYSWSGSGITSANQYQSSPSFSAPAIGIYVYNLIGAVASCTSAVSSVTITVANPPSSALTTPSIVICQGTTGFASISSPQSGVTYHWNINGGNTGQGVTYSIPSVIYGTPGTYSIGVNAVLGTGSSTCATTSGGTVIVNPTAQVYTDSSLTACIGDNPILSVTNPKTSVMYVWSNSNTNLASGFSYTITNVQENQAGIYSVVITNLFGCRDSSTVNLMVTKCGLDIPEIFSPNADGKNDKFEIKKISGYPNNKLSVFNRWGSLIYQKNGYNNEWDGTPNVSESTGSGLLPVGTYYVVFEYGDGTTKPYTGFVQLEY